MSHVWASHLGPYLWWRLRGPGSSRAVGVGLLFVVVGPVNVVRGLLDGEVVDVLIGVAVIGLGLVVLFGPLLVAMARNGYRDDRGEPRKPYPWHPTPSEEMRTFMKALTRSVPVVLLIMLVVLAMLGVVSILSTLDV